MNLKDIVLGLIGLGISIGVSYYVAWTVPWLVIFVGLYLLGIAIAWAWENWTGYPAHYSVIVTIFAFLVGVYLLVGGSAWNLLTKNWCAILPCVPLFWVLLVLVLGNVVFIARPYFNKLVQK